MSDPSSIPGFGPGPTVQPTSEKPERKTGVTKRDVSELLASFEPEPPKSESPAEKERARRIARLENGIRTLAKNLEEWGVTDGAPAEAAAALRALKTVLSKGKSAIESLTDAKLGVEVKPKIERAPRQAKPEAIEPGPDLPEEHPEAEPDADLQTNNDVAQAPSPTVRSGPPAAAAPSSANAEEGF